MPQPDTLKVAGDLSVHGITKPVALDVTLNKIGTNPRNQVPTVGFEAMATLKRSDFGLGLYVPQVSDEIQIHITAEAAEKNAYEQYLKAQAAREAAKKSIDFGNESGVGRAPRSVALALNFAASPCKVAAL